MNDVDKGLVLADLPAGVGWDFGGFTYGLEPLTLPDPRVTTLAADHDAPNSGRDGRYTGSCRLLRLMAGDDLPLGLVEPCPAEDELFWFRWITGHQVSFICWRLIAHAVEEARRGRIGQVAMQAQLCRFIRAYTAMLLYTGSCPRGVYRDVIRPSMRLRHRSFSGGWAPDYWPVRDLLRARQLPFTASPGSAELLRAVRLHQLVHDGIAAKLVPDGKSLLRRSEVRAPDPRLLNLIYDNYFMTWRAPVSRHDVVAQLLRRLVAIEQDLAVNGLYPDVPRSRDELPEELRLSQVISCENGIAAILCELAECTTGLPAPAGSDRMASAGWNSALDQSDSVVSG